MKPIVENLEVISPKVQITDSFIETDYEYQTSNVKRLPSGKIQVRCFKKFIHTACVKWILTLSSMKGQNLIFDENENIVS